MEKWSIEDSGKSAVQTVRNFIDCINAHDVAALNKLMTDHFRFVDATGATYPVTEMRKGWKSYFLVFPDYRIEVEDMIADRTQVAVFGWVSGSFQGRGYTEHGTDWRIPAAWKAVTSGPQLVEWRIYADIKAMMLRRGIHRFSS